LNGLNIVAAVFSCNYTMDDSPSSEIPASWLECSIYQNYTASEVLVQGLAGVVNQQDVEMMVRAQKKMLQRFEKTNEMLTNVNTLSSTRLDRAQNDFKTHTTTILEMKKDLDIIFKKIKTLRSRLETQMPVAYAAAVGEDDVVEGVGQDDEYDAIIWEKKAQEDLAKAAAERKDKETS